MIFPREVLIPTTPACDIFAASGLLARQAEIADRDHMLRRGSGAIAVGKSTKEAAAGLGISIKTAETHRINLMRKLNVHSIGELVSYAFRNKLVAE